MMPLTIERLVMRDRHLAIGYGRNAGDNAAVGESLAKPVGVIAPVAEQPFRLGQLVQQGCRAGVVADLACGHEEAQRATVRIGNGMELGVHAAFGAAYQAPEIPFFTARLDAVRCAFR